jgi:ribosomal protein S18 acetylase RimI-like enzyme
MEIRPYEVNDEEAVIQLWKDCGLVVSWNNPALDIQRKLKVQSEMFLVGLLDGKIVASVMAGYDGHRGWINYLAVHPDFQRKGLARKMMDAAEVCLREVGCPKINLQVRTSNTGVIEFYNRIGYKLDDVVSFGKRLVDDFT